VPRVSQSQRARADLLDIWLEIATDDPAAADRLYDRLERRVGILETFPEAGPSRPEIAPEARVLVEGSYLILYRIRTKDVQVVRVLHGARDIDEALFAEGVT
jgi:toxin ParE1/3/4